MSEAHLTSTFQDSELRVFLGDVTPKFVAWLKKAHDAAPYMFYNMDAPSHSSSRIALSKSQRHRLFVDLHAVYIAWRSLRLMNARGEKWSEGEYAAHVYDVIRTPAFHSSTARWGAFVLHGRCMLTAFQDKVQHLSGSSASKMRRLPPSKIHTQIMHSRRTRLRYTRTSLDSQPRKHFCPLHPLAI
jgi:hypothetical protein